MAFTVTLRCANCEKRETHDHWNDFIGWFTIRGVGGRNGDHYDWMCSELCGASWLMRRQFEREQAETANAR